MGAARRRSRTVSSATTQFLYDGLNPVQELASGTPTANLLTGLQIDEYMTRKDAAGARHFLTDALGSSIALTDGSGTVQTEYTYEPFGSVATTGATNTNAFGFTGRENDGTGLDYYRARYYDPQLQRFVGEDPLRLTQGPNVHAYVHNNPLSFTDPFGLATIIGTGGIEIKPPSKKWAATTRKNKITIFGSCKTFFDKPSVVLEEYYHVLEQWNKGRLSRLKYAFAYLFHGYNNRSFRDLRGSQRDPGDS